MSQHEPALQWALQHLVSCGNPNISNYQKIIHTSYSKVYRIKTTEKIFYLKKTPEILFSEPRVLNFLKEQGCTNIPDVLAKNDDLYCFLMSSCGDLSLRHLFAGKVDLGKLLKGISNYTTIQRLIENKTAQLLSFGIPDWRIDKLASLYHQLIQRDKLLLRDGLTKKEIGTLKHLYPTCTNLCKELSKYRIPETIGHCDFHENNMLLDKHTENINIIDWGETVIELNRCAVSHHF